MTSAVKYILIVILILLAGCKGENGDGSVTEQPTPELTEGPVPGTENAPVEESQDTGYTEPAVPSLEGIKAVKIRMLSAEPRDGFQVEIEYGGAPDESTSYIYEWKQNGSDLTGAGDEKLEWREGFKKGDTISVAVTPYSDIGRGAVSAEGSFKIPNSPPVITSEPGTSFEEGRFSYIVEARDPDGDSIDFSIRNAPRGMTIEPAAGLIIWEYGEKDSGDYKVTVIVTDSEGAESRQELTLSIRPRDSAAGGAE